MLWDRVLEAVAVCGILLGIFLTFRQWGTLSATIPIHFDAAGNADGFGPKKMIWLLPVISVVMIPPMLFLRRIPWLLNMPIEVTEQNAALQYGLIVRLLSLLACFISLLFLVLVYDTLSIADGGTSLLGWMFMPIFIAGNLGPIIWYFIAALKGR